MSNSKDAIRKILDSVKADKRTSLTAPEGKLVCDAYGIPVPKEGVAKSAAEAARIATGMGFPVVMKIVSPDILHKTEAGGVMVGVKTAADVEKNYDTILANAKKYKSDAKIEGIQVQQMLLGGREVIVGAVTDGSFGKLVAFGLVGRSSGSRELKATHPNYSTSIRAWQERAKVLRADIGCIDHLALHHWHGALQKRGYYDGPLSGRFTSAVQLAMIRFQRDNHLARGAFNPETAIALGITPPSVGS